MRPVVVVEHRSEGAVDLGRVVVKLKSIEGFLCLDQRDHDEPDLDWPPVHSCYLNKSCYPYSLHNLSYSDLFFGPSQAFSTGKAFCRERYSPSSKIGNPKEEHVKVACKISEFDTRNFVDYPYMDHISAADAKFGPDPSYGKGFTERATGLMCQTVHVCKLRY